jgi:pimeloyl-ACP methyl ester carboxylesterase
MIPCCLDLILLPSLLPWWTVTREVINATFVELQPATEVKVFANCGHYAMAESPLKLAAEVQDFFGGNTGEPPADEGTKA